MKQADLGAVRLTEAVTEEMLEHPEFSAHVLGSLRRFRACDWGPLSEGDRAQNEAALADPFEYGEVSAFYECPSHPAWEICIYAEIGGRRPNQTTVSLSNDYSDV